MTRTLTSRSRLDTLRKEAKRWIQALRAGDAQALQRLRKAHPTAPKDPGLRDIQHALAREYGEASWAALKEKLAELALAGKGVEARVDEFLVEACIHYGVRPGTEKWDRHYIDSPSRWDYAARILARHPSIASHSFLAAVVSGNLEEVKRRLAARPALATEKGGPAQWDPLFYVCYNRLPTKEARDNSVEIARALLDAGAGPDATLKGDLALFPALTGAIGGGEFGQPPHAQAVALAELLIERGADPWNPQALYNTALGSNDTVWPDFLYERSARRNETSKWTAASPDWPQTGIMDWLLSHAVTANSLLRARWTLERGANPSQPHFYSKRNLHTEARLNGFGEMAELLVQHGAKPENLAGHDEFQAAALRGDRATVQALAADHPEYLRFPAPLFKAAEQNRVDVATMLLDLGMSPDVTGHANTRPLHRAAANDSVEVGKLLIERGAEIDPVETYQNGVPLGWSIYAGKGALAETLARLSRHTRVLTRMGHLARLRELFAEDPSLALEMIDGGSLLFYLPDDEARAIEVAELLISHGADRLARNAEGSTPAEQAEKMGFDVLADLLGKE
jgi:ankyrin repeat protein